MYLTRITHPMRSNDDEIYVAKGATLFEKNKKKRRRRQTRKDFDNTFFENRSPKDEENLKYIINLVERQGTKIKFYKKNYLIRRTRSRINRNNITSYKEYYDLLKRDPEELANLLDALSINVTRFFRNRDSWMQLKNEIIPEIVKRKRDQGSNRVKIWSAGCAVGAEPYSISMLVDDLKYRDIDFTIQASDINADLLKIARNGVYHETYLDEMNPGQIKNYFKMMKPETYKVKDRIKNRVRFSQIDLTKDRYPAGVDLILCRNVMIYLNRDAQEIIKQKFLSSLNRDGFLFLGRTETLSGKWRRELDPVSARHRTYQKKLSSQR